MTNGKPLTETRLIAILKSTNLATKNDLKDFTTKDDLKSFATKDDLKNFATKDDLKNFATKDDIKTSERRLIRRLGQVKNDLASRIANLALSTPTLREFEKLKKSVN